MSLAIDAYSDSINRFGEDLCGEKVEIISDENNLLAIMADGPGNGVKANIFASLTIKMLTTMLTQSNDIDEAVRALIEFRHPGQSESYSAFTIIRISNNGISTITEVDMPEAVLLRRGKPAVAEKSKKRIAGKTVIEEKFILRPGDILTIFSDGVLKAGIAGDLNKEWGRELVTAYLQASYKPDLTARKLTGLLLAASSSLDNNQPSDDLTVLTVRASSARPESCAKRGEVRGGL